MCRTLVKSSGVRHFHLCLNIRNHSSLRWARYLLQFGPITPSGMTNLYNQNLLTRQGSIYDPQLRPLMPVIRQQLLTGPTVLIQNHTSFARLDADNNLLIVSCSCFPNIAPYSVSRKYGNISAFLLLLWTQSLSDEVRDALLMLVDKHFKQTNQSSR